MKGWTLLLGLAGALGAQGPAFEVATVKPNQTATAIGGRGICFGQGSVSRTAVPLDLVIEETFGIRSVQVAGAPAWLASERFDIEARPPKPVGYAECRQMMQTLLMERFGLKFHRETRQLPIYRLTVAKGGHKLRQTDQQRGARIFDTRSGRLVSAGIPMEYFARMLTSAGEVEKMVIDATGLSGPFEFELHWAPQGLTADGTSGTSIFTALQEQLGLKLEAGRGPVEVLVIDHINRQPTEN